jgi:hypothetical protein
MHCTRKYTNQRQRWLISTVGGYALHFMLGEDVSARLALVDTLIPTLGLNLILAAPVFALCRMLLIRDDGVVVAPEVRLLG